MKINFTSQDVKKIKEDNFIVKKKVISLKKLKKLNNEFEKISRKIKNKRDIHFFKNGSKKIVSSIHNIHLYSKYYKKFIKSSRLSDLVKQVYGSKSDRVFNASLFAKPAELGLETRPHQDNAFFNLSKGEALTCWMPIDNSSSKNGTMFYYKNSARLGDLEHIPKGNVGASMTIKNKTPLKNFKKKFVEVKKGDCIIHNALVVHGSKKNVSKKSRRAFNFSIASRDKINKKKFSVYKLKLRSFLQK